MYEKGEVLNVHSYSTPPEEVLMKLIDAGEQSVVISDVNEGLGVASTVISPEILPEQPELVLSEES